MEHKIKNYIKKGLAMIFMLLASIYGGLEVAVYCGILWIIFQNIDMGAPA